MGRGIRVGTLLGFPIRVDYSWFIIFGIFSFAMTMRFLPDASLPVSLLLGLATTVLLFGSVLVHELAHSVVARARGLPVGGITLFIFGGVSELGDEPDSPGLEFEMAVVGPLMSLALGVIFLLVWLAAGRTGHPIVRTVTQQLCIINIALAFFNLMPGLPLDGGRILRAAVWHLSGDLRLATQIATIGGQVLGYGLIGLGIILFFISPELLVMGIWFAFIGWFLLGAAQQSYQRMAVREALAGVPVGMLARRDAVALPGDLSVQRLVDEYLLRYSANVFPVVSEGRVLGTVGLNEIHQAPREAWNMTAVSQIMRPVTEDDVVSEDLDAWEAVQRLGRSECECLLLTRGDELAGLVTRDSLLRWLHTQRQLRR